MQRVAGRPDEGNRCAFVFQVAAACIVLTGFVAILLNKSFHGKDHFTSPHSWLAAAALFLFAVQECARTHTAAATAC